MSNNSILDKVGKTPIVEVDGILAKLETTNPTGSVKDRMASYMIRKAEERGELKPGQVILEVTSGNTGIALSMISAVRGYHFIAVMPESMSIERRRMMQAFGAELVLTPAAEDMAGAVKKYEELKKQYPEAWLSRQFDNPDNIKGHEEGLGQEIVQATNGKIDAFVAAAGTGGTLIGVAKALKKANPKVYIAIVEPTESAVLSGGQPGLHGIQGIGEGFIPKIIADNRDIIDEIITISTEDAKAAREELIKKHGILVGISSGANLLAAKKLKERFETVVTLFADRGERYLS